MPCFKNSPEECATVVQTAVATPLKNKHEWDIEIRKSFRIDFHQWQTGIIHRQQFHSGQTWNNPPTPTISQWSKLEQRTSGHWGKLKILRIGIQKWKWKVINLFKRDSLGEENSIGTVSNEFNSIGQSEPSSKKC